MNDEYGEITNPEFGEWKRNTPAGLEPEADGDSRVRKDPPVDFEIPDVANEEVE